MTINARKKTTPKRRGTSKRAKGLSKQETYVFLLWLGMNGVAKDAADFAGRPLGTFESKKSRDPIFKAQWKAALVAHVDLEPAFWEEMLECGIPAMAASRVGLCPRWVARRMIEPGFRARVQALKAKEAGGYYSNARTAAKDGDSGMIRFMLKCLAGDLLGLNGSGNT